MHLLGRARDHRGVAAVAVGVAEAKSHQQRISVEAML